MLRDLDFIVPEWAAHSWDEHDEIRCASFEKSLWDQIGREKPEWRETEAGHRGVQERGHCNSRRQECEAEASGLQAGLDSRQTVPR